jgi:2-polyprenyl-3-methyl-5-hydroxy-6-metoxy-1,4-benzoquinol methylase
VRRYLDARFKALEHMIQANMDAANEATTLFGQQLNELAGLVEQVSDAHVKRMADGAVAHLDEATAELIDRATSYAGFAAERGLWFNPPIIVKHSPWDVVVSAVNERIAELPYVFRALAGLPSGSRVLDVGASESTVSLSLAALGYQVTALDPRPYPLAHPSLRVVGGTVEEWSDEEPFAAVVCLSVVEHIGLGAYGLAEKEGADLVAMRRMRELTAPGGLLVMTTRFGEAATDDFQRTYDRAGLDELLEGWDVEDLSFLHRQDATTWVPAEPMGELQGEAVVLVTARRPEDA